VLGFHSHVADTADQVVPGTPALFNRNHLDRIGIVVRAQYKLSVCHLDILHGASAIPVHGIHVRFAAAKRFERVVMTIDQNGGAREEARIHAHAFAGICFDEDKTFPCTAATLGFGAEISQKRFLELQYVFHIHAHDDRFGSCDRAIDQHNGLKFVFTRRNDAGALVDFCGIEEVEDRKVLNFENLVHAFQAEPALAVEKVGDVSLLKSGLLGQAQAGYFAFLDALPQGFAEVFLESFKFHPASITLLYINMLLQQRQAHLKENRFPQPDHGLCSLSKYTFVTLVTANICQ